MKKERWIKFKDRLPEIGQEITVKVDRDYVETVNCYNPSTPFESSYRVVSDIDRSELTFKIISDDPYNHCVVEASKLYSWLEITEVAEFLDNKNRLEYLDI